jgi:hypothetical protein
MSGLAGIQSRSLADVVAVQSCASTSSTTSVVAAATATIPPQRSSSALRQLFLRPNSSTSSDSVVPTAPPADVVLPSLFVSAITPETATNIRPHEGSIPLPSLFLHQAPSSIDMQIAATVTPGTTWQHRRYRFDSVLGNVLDTKTGKTIPVTSVEWFNLLRVIVQDPPPTTVRVSVVLPPVSLAHISLAF